MRPFTGFNILPMPTYILPPYIMVDSECCAIQIFQLSCSCEYFSHLFLRLTDTSRPLLTCSLFKIFRRYKRNIVLGTMCGAGESSCLSQASRYFQNWMEKNQSYVTFEKRVFNSKNFCFVRSQLSVSDRKQIVESSLP